MKGGTLDKIAYALVIPILLVLIAGGIVLATAYVWLSLGQRELSWQSMLLAWAIAAIVLCAVFLPLVLLEIRRQGPLPERRPGDPPPIGGPTTSLAPFAIAAAATVLAIVILWTSNLGE